MAHSGEDQGPPRRTPMVALSTAFLVSVLGTSMSAIAVPWLVLTTTGSAGHTGLVLFFQLAPYVLMLAIGGPWVDRLGPHRVFWIGYSVAGLLMSSVPVLYAAGGLSLVDLAALTGMAGIARGLADCSNVVLVPGVARLGHVAVERVSGLNSAANQTGLLLGAPLGGVLLTFVDPPYVLLIDGLSFLIAAGLVGILVPRSAQEPSPDGDQSADGKQSAEAGGYLSRLRTGFTFLRHDRLLLGLGAMIAVTNFTTSALGDVLVPTWVLDRGHSASALGVVSACMAGGSLAGNLIGAWLGSRMRKWAMYSIGFLIGASPLFGTLASSSSVLLAGVVAVIAGLATGSINPILGGVWYRRIPHALLARVIGAVRASAWIGVPFGPLLGGALADGWGVTATLWSFGGWPLPPRWHRSSSRPSGRWTSRRRSRRMPDTRCGRPMRVAANAG